jgi:glycosyltransferase involved in cell wall biosynthesis
VLAEAMLMQTPCVATDVGDAALIIGASGTLVPPGDPAALAEALLAFERLPEPERLARGRAARQRIEHEYSIEVIARRYADLYEQEEVR